ncbi:uncharacterized protein METZ01_LOCUS420619, partial [marine metagenome]
MKIMFWRGFGGSDILYNRLNMRFLK